MVGKITKRILIILLVIIVSVPFLYFLSWTLLCPAINDARATKIEKELMKMELPPQTVAIETDSFCGNTTGTGNHVEIWAGILIRSELSEKELRQYYEGKTISYAVYDSTVWSVPEDLTMQYPEPRSFINFSYFNTDFLTDKTKAVGYYIIGGYYDAVTQHDQRGY